MCSCPANSNMYTCTCTFNMPISSAAHGVPTVCTMYLHRNHVAVEIHGTCNVMYNVDVHVQYMYIVCACFIIYTVHVHVRTYTLTWQGCYRQGRKVMSYVT